MTAPAPSAPVLRRSAAPGVAIRIVGEAAPHALMLLVMAATMSPGATSATRLAGIVLLTATTIVLAPSSRRRRHLRAVILDVWAMILVLVLHAPAAAAASHGHASWPAAELSIFVVVAWLVARAAMTRDRPGIVTAVLTGAQLVLMLAIGMAE